MKNFWSKLIEALCQTLSYENGISILFNENEDTEIISSYNLPEKHVNITKKIIPSLRRFVTGESLHGNKIFFFESQNYPEEKAFLNELFSRTNKKNITLTIISNCENVSGALLLFKDFDSKSPEEIDALKCLSVMLHTILLNFKDSKAPSISDKFTEQVKFMETIMENSYQPFTIGYADGGMVYSNKAYCDLLGYTTEELLKISWRDFTPEEYFPVETNAFNSNKNIKAIYEKEYIKKDGSRIYVSLSLHQILEDKNGKICCFIFVNDITQKKVSEEKLLKMSSELENIIAERTNELSIAYEKIKNSFFIEKLTSDMLYRTLNTSPENLEKEIVNILKEISNYFKQNECAVFLYSEKKIEELFRWSYDLDYSAAEIIKIIEKVFDELSPIRKRLEAYEIVNLDNVEKNDPISDPLFWKTLKIKSVIYLPLFINNEFKGCLSLKSNTLTRKWSEEEISSLKLFAHVLEGILTNIKYQKELAESHKLFSTFMDHFPEGVFIKDENSKISYVNKVFENYFSLKREEIIGKSIFELHDYETARKFSEQDAKILSSEEHEGLNIETEVEFGNYIVRKFKIPKNSSSFMIGGIAFNIAARKKLEDELSKSERKYRHLVELAREGYLRTDKNGIICYVNKRLCEIIGHAKDELTGVSIFNLFKYTKQENLEIVKTAFESCKKGYQNDFTIVIKPDNNQNIHLKITTSPIFEENGLFDGTLSLITDCTKEIELEKEVSSTRRKLLEDYSYHGIYCKSESMKKIMELLQVVANSDCNILIEGPSGTGKTHIAKIIHYISNRHEKPFITVNCGALPENLLESELFGYLKGAFTGADKDKPGKFSAASGGIIFLDEIGEMPLNLQVKLLRVIEEKCYEPIGSNQTVKIDVKIIAATNKNLYSLVNEGKFRSDLYYRLKIISFTIPSLKERPEDIDIIIESFINIFNNKYNKNIIRLSDEAFCFLKAYDFPGNIRELKNMLERAVIFCDGAKVEIQHFANEYISLFQKMKKIDINDLKAQLEIKESVEDETGVSKSGEKESLIKALKSCNNNRSEAAKTLNISKATLWRKIKKYDLDHLFEKLHKNDSAEVLKNLDATLSNVEKNEKKEIIASLQKTSGNKTKAAEILNIDRITLWRKMKKYGIK